MHDHDKHDSFKQQQEEESDCFRNCFFAVLLLCIGLLIATYFIVKGI